MASNAACLPVCLPACLLCLLQIPSASSPASYSFTTFHLSSPPPHTQIYDIMNEQQRKNAELSLYKRKPKEAISMLLQATPPLIYDAIKTCIRLFHWEQALNIAKRTGDGGLLDLVLWYRAQYLQRLPVHVLTGRKEEEDIIAFKNLNRERSVVSSREQLAAIKAAVKPRFHASKSWGNVCV